MGINLKLKNTHTKPEVKPEPKSEWDGMPEFQMEKQEPHAKIIVRFESEEDLQDFAEKIGQKLTKRTKSIWHPQIVRGLNAHLRYVDDE